MPRKTPSNKYQRISITNDFDEKFELFKNIIERDTTITAYIEKEITNSDGKKKCGCTGKISPAIRYLIEEYIKKYKQHTKITDETIRGDDTVETTNMDISKTQTQEPKIF